MAILFPLTRSIYRSELFHLGSESIDIGISWSFTALASQDFAQYDWNKKENLSLLIASSAVSKK
jgi:hypothetical protein